MADMPPPTHRKKKTMSDPRMIPADEAKRLREAAGSPRLVRYSTTFRDHRSHSVKSTTGMVRAHTGYGPDGGTAHADAELFAAAPDLAHTVVEQAARIDQLDTELRARAADTLEYRVEHQHIENGVWHPLTQWSPE